MNRIVFASGKDDWQTPANLMQELSTVVTFDLDAAATKENAVCEDWLGPESDIAEDALTCDWGMWTNIFLNPPYSQVRAFVAKAFEQAKQGRNDIFLLLPSRTDTRWFHDYIWDREQCEPRMGVNVMFLKGRLKFVDPTRPDITSSAPFPSMIVRMRGEYM